MGLDMYLSIKRNLEFKPINDGQYDGLYYEKDEKVGIGYWRKFWALHDFIVRRCAEVDDCKPILLRKDTLEAILSSLKAIDESPNKTIASMLLPPDITVLTNDDFFEWYLQEVKRSIPIFELAIKTLEEPHDCDTYIVYRASW